jgi:hypothetical protein
MSIPSPALTPADAGALAKRARKLLRAGLLTAKQYVLLDILLWSCRGHNGQATVSYTRLQRLTRQSRETIVGGIRKLIALGLIGKIKRRARVAWLNGATASRQLANSYSFRTQSSDAPPASKEQLKILPMESAPATVRAARDALRRRAETIQATLARHFAPFSRQC